MRHRYIKYLRFTHVKIILGSIILIALVQKSTMLNKLSHLFQKPTPAIPQKEKEKLVSAKTTADTNDNNFLFVDCTGFFE